MSKQQIFDKIKDWFTDAVGAVMMILSLVLVYYQQIEFLWEGFWILFVGFVLVVIPDKEIAAAIKVWAKKKFGSEEQKVR